MSQWLMVLLTALVTSMAGAVAPSSEQTLRTVAFEQKVGAPLPSGLSFTTQYDERVEIDSLSSDKPMVLVLAWLECPNLCSMLLDNLALAIGKLPFAAETFNVVIVSIDPREMPDNSRKAIRRLEQKYGPGMDKPEGDGSGLDGSGLDRPGVKSWIFLTGEREAIEALADAVGYRYAYDPERDSFAHPAGYVVVAPGGIINRYLFSIEPSAPDLRLALLDAADGKLGRPVDQVVLRCYRFDADSGRYNLAVMRIIQVVALIFIVGLVALVWRLRARTRGRNGRD